MLCAVLLRVLLISRNRKRNRAGVLTEARTDSSLLDLTDFEVSLLGSLYESTIIDRLSRTLSSGISCRKRYRYASSIGVLLCSTHRV